MRLPQATEKAAAAPFSAPPPVAPPAPRQPTGRPHVTPLASCRHSLGHPSNPEAIVGETRIAPGPRLGRILHHNATAVVDSHAKARSSAGLQVFDDFSDRHARPRSIRVVRTDAQHLADHLMANRDTACSATNQDENPATIRMREAEVVAAGP